MSPGPMLPAPVLPVLLGPALLASGNRLARGVIVVVLAALAPCEASGKGGAAPLRRAPVTLVVDEAFVPVLVVVVGGNFTLGRFSFTVLSILEPLSVLAPSSPPALPFLSMRSRGGPVLLWSAAPILD